MTKKKLMALLFTGLMGLGGVACEGEASLDGERNGDEGGVELEGDVEGEGEGEGGD